MSSECRACVRVYFVSSFAEIRDYAQSFVRFVVKTLCSARHIRLTKTLTDEVAHLPYKQGLCFLLKEPFMRISLPLGKESTCALTC